MAIGTDVNACFGRRSGENGNANANIIPRTDTAVVTAFAKREREPHKLATELAARYGMMIVMFVHTLAMSMKFP